MMTSRERLLAVLNGRMPDRVPISSYELVGYNSQAWENREVSYAHLMDTIRASTDCICMWEPTPIAGGAPSAVNDERALATSSQTFLVSSNPAPMEVETRREGDTVIVHRTLHTPTGDLTQTTRASDNVHTVWQVEHWCKSLDDVDRALSVPYQPVDYATSDLARIHAEVGEHGIVMTSIADPLWLAADLMAFGEYTIWAMTETEHFARTVAALHERVMENLRRMLDTPVDLYRIAGPEYATPPFLPPRLFQRFVVPYVAEMVDLIHSRGAKVRLHCHGKIRRVLDMILETGADGLDPCEPPPDGDIGLAELKVHTAGRLCLFGNIELKLLETGTVDEVEVAVRDCMAAAKSGGGFVIMPTAAPINIPLAQQTEENYLRFIATAVACGAY